MSRKPRDLRAGMASVENQEGGEAPMGDTPSVTPPATLPPAVVAAPPIAPGQVNLPPMAPGQITLPADNTGWDQSSGQLSGAESLQLEIDILTADAVDRVACAIAERVAAKAPAAKLKSVAVISPTMLAALRLHATLDAQVKSLQAIAEQAAAAAPPTSVQTEDATAFIDPSKVVDTAQRVLKSASSALSVFASTTAYAGKKDSAKQTVLDAALARHLGARGLQVDLPEHALPAMEADGLLARMLALRSRCGELERSGADLNIVLPVGTAIDNLIKLAFGTDTPATGAPLGQQLMLADAVGKNMAAGRAVLLVEIVFSGGSYRMRKWIFNTLFGRDGLTYGGGAGVTYFLFKADDRRTLDSDTLYFSSPHGRFHHGGGQQFEPSNLNR